LLLCLYIIVLCNRLLANPKLEMHPRTFIFAAKAAPGYAMAKLIIQLIHGIAEVVNSHESVSRVLRVAFLPDYRVSLAERIIPEGPVADADFYVESYGDYRRNQGKSKRAACRACRWFAECEGPWKEYPELYGWSEFKPVKAGKRAKA